MQQADQSRRVERAVRLDPSLCPSASCARHPRDGGVRQSNFTANASCCVVPSTACGMAVKFACPISRVALPHRRRPGACARASRSVMTIPCASVPTARDRIRVADVERHFRAPANCRRRASQPPCGRRRHNAIGRGVRNSWCAAQRSFAEPCEYSSGERGDHRAH